MKVKINSRKGLKANLSVLVDKKTIQKKMDEKLNELQNKIHLKGFRPGKVPPKVIKNQFGKAIYGEVIDGILKETSTKAIEENKLKVAVQPKIDLKTFGEGKDLDYTIELETLPEIKLKPFEKIKATEYEISIEQKLVDKRIDQLKKDKVIRQFTTIIDTNSEDSSVVRALVELTIRPPEVKGQGHQHQNFGHFHSQFQDFLTYTKFWVDD